MITVISIGALVIFIPPQTSSRSCKLFRQLIASKLALHWGSIQLFQQIECAVFDLLSDSVRAMPTIIQFMGAFILNPDFQYEDVITIV